MLIPVKKLNFVANSMNVITIETENVLQTLSMMSSNNTLCFYDETSQEGLCIDRHYLIHIRKYKSEKHA